MAAFISKIFAGEFNQRIKLKSLNATQDAFGGISSTYTTHTTIWANKNVKSLRDVKEKFEGKELQSYSRFVYTIRYSSETKVIKSNWILEEVSSGESYDILGYVIDPRKEFIEIFVKQDLPTESPI
jgi:SPP1 family predicted phage head-tail adaptor